MYAVWWCRQRRPKHVAEYLIKQYSVENIHTCVWRLIIGSLLLQQHNEINHLKSAISLPHTSFNRIQHLQNLYVKIALWWTNWICACTAHCNAAMTSEGHNPVLLCSKPVQVQTCADAATWSTTFLPHIAPCDATLCLLLTLEFGTQSSSDSFF